MKEEHMGIIAAFVDEVISNIDNEAVIKSVGARVEEFVKPFPLFHS
jgi:glycine/serine hydroxymethyltransferase